jgi:DNA-binding GntR family transcriptional regulator
MSPERTTRTESVLAHLRSDILGGVFEPGQRLPFAELRERYEASAGVVREALLRLADQGLALAEPQQGFRVVQISVDDLRELTEARIEVETLVLRYAVRSADITWESELVAAHHRLERSPQLDDSSPERFNDDWARGHQEFHNVALSGCPNKRLLGLALSLRDSAELYRRWSLPIGHDKARDVRGEHKALLEAILARDEEQAVRILTEHIERTTRVLINVLEH